MNTQWDDLMEECIDIREDQDAKSFFKAVESLAKVLDLTIERAASPRALARG